MPLNTSAVNVGAVAIAADLTKVGLHTGDPGAAGTSNTTTAAQKTVTFSASAGVVSLSATASFTGGAASGPVTYVSLWSGTTYRGSQPIETGDVTFNAAGEYDLTALTITGSASN